MSRRPDRETVEQAISEFRDPELGRSIRRGGQLHRLEIDDGRIDVSLGLTTFSAPLWHELGEELRSLLSQRFPECQVHVAVEKHDRPPQPLGQTGMTVRSVIAVGSGKGGVGKSTLAASLAFGLQRQGATVGLMDADVYGPSIPHLLGLNGRPYLVEGRIQPVRAGDMPVMSMGLLVPKEEAVIWRGPMLHQAIQQFIRDTDWGTLDYLVIDLPPGTGDVALSISQLVPLSGAVIVCTPQEVALLDAVKAITMFRKVNIDVLGIVENMSFFICPECSSRHEIFGSGGARTTAESLNVPFLGEVPLVGRLRELGDAGAVAETLEDPLARPYLEGVCQNVVRQLITRRRKAPPKPQLPVL